MHQTYTCDLCGTPWASEQEAIDCEASHPRGKALSVSAAKGYESGIRWPRYIVVSDGSSEVTYSFFQDFSQAGEDDRWVDAEAVALPVKVAPVEVAPIEEPLEAVKG